MEIELACQAEDSKAVILDNSMPEETFPLLSTFLKHCHGFMTFTDHKNPANCAIIHQCNHTKCDAHAHTHVFNQDLETHMHISYTHSSLQSKCVSPEHMYKGMQVCVCVCVCDPVCMYVCMCIRVNCPNGL